MLRGRAVSASYLRFRRFSSTKIESSTSPISDEDLCEHFSDRGIPRVAITKDRRTIVMYHPESTIDYEDTISVPRDDPRYSAHENVESLVREKLDDLGIADKPLENPTVENPWPMKNKETLPTMVQLANMFYTTKHIWFPNKKARDRAPEDDRRRD